MMYDDSEALLFITTKTNESPKVVQRFLEARFRYQELNYLVEPQVDPAAERALHEDVITNTPDNPSKYEDRAMVLRYVRRVTGISEDSIANMMAEETAYMAEQGIVAPGCYEEEREWAAAIQQALKRQSEDLGNWTM